MLKGIVFDLDGTLVDSLGTTFDAFNHAIVSLGGEPRTPDQIMSYFGTGEDEIFSKILGPKKAAAAYAISVKYMDENVGYVPLHKGVEDLLENLKSHGVPISIFTGRSWDTTELILKHHRILDQFITVIASDHVVAPKPSPEGLHLALKRMGLDPQQVLFIGDSPMDIMAGRTAGAQGVAALWDLLAERDELAKYKPHHWASHPREIWEIYQK